MTVSTVCQRASISADLFEVLHHGIARPWLKGKVYDNSAESEGGNDCVLWLLGSSRWWYDRGISGVVVYCAEARHGFKMWDSGGSKIAWRAGWDGRYFFSLSVELSRFFFSYGLMEIASALFYYFFTYPAQTRLDLSVVPHKRDTAWSWEFGREEVSLLPLPPIPTPTHS